VNTVAMFAIRLFTDFQFLCTATVVVENNFKLIKPVKHKNVSNVASFGLKPGLATGKKLSNSYS